MHGSGMQTSACDLLFSYRFSNRQMFKLKHLTILTFAYGKSLLILQGQMSKLALSIFNPPSSNYYSSELSGCATAPPRDDDGRADDHR